MRHVRAGLVLGIAVLLCTASPAHAGDPLKDLLTALQGSDDTTTRRALIRKIVARNSPRAAARLVRIISSDPDPEVRAEAARGLGRMDDVKSGADLLFLVLDRGGVKQVRRATAEGLVKRGGQIPRLAAVIDDPKAPALSRGLAIDALAAFPDPESVVILERLARGDDPFLRVAGLRALGRHRQGRETLAGVLVAVLMEHHDIDTLMTVLDLAASLADRDFRPVADLLDTFLQPEVAPAVEAARARIEYLEALAKYRKRKGTVYAGSGEPPDPPPPRPRLDMVYVYDGTGSVVGHLDLIVRKIKSEAEVLSRAGGDVRIGLVAYRDTPKRRSSWETKVLPLTYDVERMERFFRRVGYGGADSRGAAVARGLHQSYDRMGWRWNGRRHTMIVADSKAGNPSACKSIARIHFVTDRTRLHVWYLARTRTRLPESIRDLAFAGGGQVRVLDRYDDE